MLVLEHVPAESLLALCETSREFGVLAREVGAARMKHAPRWAALGVLSALAAAAGHKRVIAISAASGDGVATLLPRIHKLLADAKLKPMPAPAEVALRLDEDDDADEASGEACEVEQVEPGAWRVTGAKIEKAASMTNWDYYEAQARARKRRNAREPVRRTHLCSSRALSRPGFGDGGGPAAPDAAVSGGAGASIAQWAARLARRATGDESWLPRWLVRREPGGR